ncbi:Alpha/Beta hydrolase protein [Globomyces pollinis-pini]|nr:Alpha/Beta hydrolase protein [Globomyces pollinis-pini]
MLLQNFLLYLVLVYHIANIGIRKFLFTFKNQVDFAKVITSGRKTTTPTPLDVSITKVKIQRRDNIVVKNTVGAHDYNGTFNAEWVDYDKNGPTEKMERVILYIHGGAYFLGNRRTHRIMTWRLAKYSNARVLSIDYRLAPEHKFPAPIIDIISAYQSLINPTDPSQKKYLPSQVTFAGDSAGGCLAIASMLYCRDSEGLFPIPGACVGMSPWVDLTQSLPAWHLNEEYDYLPDAAYDPKYVSDTRHNVYVEHDDDITHPYASPILCKEIENLPISPLLIQVGGTERVRDDGIFFAEESFKTSNIRLEIYAESSHVFQALAPVDKFSRMALKRIGQFINEQTGLSIEGRPEILRESFRFDQSEGFPMEKIHDAGGILEDGINTLIERGIWRTKELEDGTLEVLHPKK